MSGELLLEFEGVNNVARLESPPNESVNHH